MSVPPDPSRRDQDLVRRFQAGDRLAFDRLVELHQKETYRLSYRLLLNHADADDLAQEAFLRAYQALGRFRGDSSFRTWLTRIVLNLATDRRRHRATHRRLSLEEVPERDLPVQKGVNPTGPIQKEVLQRAVRLLPPRQRETLILRIFQEMRFQEIATVMGCTVGTAKANFFHALKGLREKVRA